MGMHGFALRISERELQEFLEIAKPAPAEDARLPPNVTEEQFDAKLDRVLPLVLERTSGGSSPERIASMKGNQKFRQRMIALLYGDKGDKKPVVAFLAQREARALRLEKTFHAMHWLITGTVAGGEPPLANAVLGGAEYGPDLGYGRVRYLQPPEVAAVSNALGALSPDALMQRWDLKALRNARIYAVADADGRDECALRYPVLRAYFADAARDGNAMLSYIL